MQISPQHLVCLRRQIPGYYREGPPPVPSSTRPRQENMTARSPLEPPPVRLSTVVDSHHLHDVNERRALHLPLPLVLPRRVFVSFSRRHCAVVSSAAPSGAPCFRDQDTHSPFPIKRYTTPLCNGAELRSRSGNAASRFRPPSINQPPKWAHPTHHADLSLSILPVCGRFL